VKDLSPKNHEPKLERVQPQRNWKEFNPNETPSRIPEPLPQRGSGAVVRDLLRCGFARAKKSFLGIVGSLRRYRPQERLCTVFPGSRETAAEQVPHPARPPAAGYAGIRDGVS